jgi:hypothetical protein
MKNSESVICYLANRGIRNYYDLFKSLYLLNRNFLKYYKHDVVIFCEANYNHTIRKIFTIFFNVLFIEIDLKEYYNLNKSEIIIDSELANYGVGYRSMCYFFFYDFSNYLKKMGYQFYCRLDTDSFITSKVEFDFFHYLKSKKVYYGYIAEIIESKIAVKGLNEFFNENEFLKSKLDSENSVFENGLYNLRCVYTNFEVIDLDLFDLPEVKKYIRTIINSNNIFNYRWGDAPLRTIMISLFLKKNQIVRFSKINYRHQLFIQKNGRIFDDNTLILKNNINPIGELF